MNPLEAIDDLKEELDRLRPLPPTVIAQVEQKLRLEANYHSNAIEGNTLSLGETRSLILHGLTAHGKPMRDHLDIEGHDAAVKSIEDAVRNDDRLNEVFIRNLHKVLLKEPYEADAVTQDGTRVKRTITVGDYKTTPNNVKTSTGETYYFTPPEQVKPAMSDLIDWYRKQEQEDEHPLIIAATFHYRFVRIHPFDDGNGRMARLLMNMILIKHGYTVALVRMDGREEYLKELEQVDKTENLIDFIHYIARCCEYSLNLHLKAARGEPMEEVDDIDREIALFRRSLSSASDETMSAREHIESILHPFYDYCQSKTRMFSDMFGRVETQISIFATGIDGEVVNICEDSRTWPHLLTKPDLANEMRSVSFKSSIYLTTFQGRPNEHVLIQIENNASARRCQWDFFVGGTHPLKYEGRDLEEVEKRFNEIIRKMMDDLKQSSS